MKTREKRLWALRGNGRGEAARRPVRRRVCHFASSLDLRALTVNDTTYAGEDSVESGKTKLELFNAAKELFDSAIRRKEELREEINNLELPKNPLDDIIDKLGGASCVAEMTGRRGRFVRKADGATHLKLREKCTAGGLEEGQWEIWGGGGGSSRNRGRGRRKSMLRESEGRQAES